MLRQDYRLAIDNAWLQLHRTITDNNAGDSSTRHHVFNISRGGLRFSSTEIFETQERVNVILHLPNDTEHKSLGRICYCEPDESSKACIYYGVSFLDNFLDMTPFQKP
ncbi:MAG TPA: PilZ domain-containing protein [Gammaproteobacteria bacterium]|nr:PilZ domain-containing protein [Gammaproteobacteria bacterium]